MSRFWNYAPNLTPGETARSEEVNAQFSAINTALGAVETEMNRALRVGSAANPGLTQSFLEALESAAQRANKVLGFNATGQPVAIAAAFVFRGNWQTGSIYAINDIVQVGVEKSLWVAVAAHTASALFATDSPTKWLLMLDLTELRKAIRTFQIVTSAQSPFQAAAGDDLMVDVSGGSVTVTLPANPSISDQPISIVHVAGPIGANNIIVARNNQNIMGLAENMAVTDTNAALELGFCNTAAGWRLVRGT